MARCSARSLSDRWRSAPDSSSQRPGLETSRIKHRRSGRSLLSLFSLQKLTICFRPEGCLTAMRQFRSLRSASPFPKSRHRRQAWWRSRLRHQRTFAGCQLQVIRLGCAKFDVSSDPSENGVAKVFGSGGYHLQVGRHPEPRCERYRRSRLKADCRADAAAHSRRHR